MSEIITNNSDKKKTGSYLLVKEHILSRFHVGDKLPSEEELTHELGTTPYAVLKGLSELAAEGLVQREKRKGSFLVAKRHTRPGGSVGTIAFIGEEFENFMEVEILRGVEKYFRSRSLGVTLLTSGYDPTIEKANLVSLGENNFAGAVVLLSEHPSSLQELKRLVSRGLPIVQIDRCSEVVDTPWVTVDHQRSAYEGVKYLIELGHRRIGHITYRKDVMERLGSALQRRNGYCEALTEAGIAVRPEYTEAATFFGMDQKISASLFYQMAYESMHRLLSLPERPTAVFLVHDDFALGALRAVENHGLKVPDDISLLGFNDDPIAQHLSVPLTTMAQPFREIGRTAAEVLDSVISGREIPERRVRLNARLVVRASTAPIRK